MKMYHWNASEPAIGPMNSIAIQNQGRMIAPSPLVSKYLWYTIQ